MSKFLSKLKSKAKYLALTAVSAISCVALAVCAGAEGEATAPTMSSVIADAGASFQSSIGELVTAVVPVILGAFGIALIIFGVMWLIKTVKKVFTKSSN